jgi:hypothetical protein
MLIEVTIPLNGVAINSEKFERNTNPNYMHSPFDLKDVKESTLVDVRRKKKEKYGPISREANEWLHDNFVGIRIKHKVSDVNVNCRFKIISNLGIVPKATK